MEKLSFNDILNKKNGFEQVLNTDRKYSFDLVYNTNKNIKKAENELEDIRDSMPDDVNEFLEYQQKKISLAGDLGAEVARTQEGGVQITSTEELSVEEFNKEHEKLREEYSEAIEEQEEVNKERQKIVDNHVAEIDWEPLKKEYFPEDIDPNELPIQIIDIIEK